MVIILKSSDGSGAGTAYGPFKTTEEADALLDQMFPKPTSEDEDSEYWTRLGSGLYEWIYTYWYDVLTIRPIEEMDADA